MSMAVTTRVSPACSRACRSRRARRSLLAPEPISVTSSCTPWSWSCWVCVSRLPWSSVAWLTRAKPTVRGRRLIIDAPCCPRLVHAEMVGPRNGFVKGFRGPVAYLEDGGFTGDGPAGGKRPFSAGRYRLPRVGAGDRMFPREPFMRRHRISEIGPPTGFRVPGLAVGVGL